MGTFRRRKGRRRVKWIKVITMLVQIMCVVTFLDTVAATYCDLDTGRTTITDGSGYPRSVYISVSRDGSVWLRLGVDRKSDDWRYVREYKHAHQEVLISSDSIEMLQGLNYTDACVLTDMTMEIRMDKGWHPSFVRIYRPEVVMKTVDLVTIRRSKDCHKNTSLLLSESKQNLVCNGGVHNECGYRHLPAKGDQSTGTVFLTSLNFDPQGTSKVLCQRPPSRNSYTLTGSYYYAYVKLASCPPLKDSQHLGYESKMRPHEDSDRNMVLIPDPTQTALAQSTVKGWHVFAKTMSIEHEVYLQVWRPHSSQKDSYFLVGQTLFTPTELRFQEVPLANKEDYLSLSKNDVLGIYFANQNPIGFSTVPCASNQQRYLYVKNPSEVSVGKTLQFHRASQQGLPCRQYSFTAILANKSSSKRVDDWVCPNNPHDRDSHNKRQEPASRTSHDTKVAADGGKVTTFKKPPDIDSDMALSVNYIMMIIGGLLLLMIVIGTVSYYRAIKS